MAGVVVLINGDWFTSFLAYSEMLWMYVWLCFPVCFSEHLIDWVVGRAGRAAGVIRRRHACLSRRAGDPLTQLSRRERGGGRRLGGDTFHNTGQTVQTRHHRVLITPHISWKIHNLENC